MQPQITPIAITDELQQSYLDYAMSVIVSRALPDVRDGLKPVHRRVLYAMHELSNDYNKAYKKSARVVGDVIGKYHPHGDTAVYDAIVRLAQPFSMRYMLIDGQGNFGSVDADPPAAMRYTEVRMQKLTHALLDDLDKETVDWEGNYDGSETMPSVLPARFPNLLVNGTTGIAVGMATNMAPHNLTEVLNACLAFADNQNLDTEALSAYISGPDFPTGGIIYGKAGIIDAYKTGKGRLHLRGRHTVEPFSKDRERVVFTELPYQVNKAKLIEDISRLAADKKIDGISAIRDESDKDGLRVVIELKKGENADVLVNNLFNQTALESSFSINMVALDNGQPRLMTLKDLIAAFIRHRQEVVTRRTIFELKRAKERGHLLEGLTLALSNIDKMIALIKVASNKAAARDTLLARVWNAAAVSEMLAAAGSSSVRPDVIEDEDLDRPFGLNADGYRLSPNQVNAILEMQLHRLTGLEQEKLTGEYRDILQKIAELGAILSNFDKLMMIIKDELLQIRNEFGEPRKTDIVESRTDFAREDLIVEQTVVLTVSRTGYAKTQSVDDYAAQKRGGRGKSAASVKDEDDIAHLLVISTHDTVLCFTNTGRAFSLRGFEVPMAGRNSRGRPLVNLIGLEEGETITAILPVPLSKSELKELKEAAKIANQSDEAENLLGENDGESTTPIGNANKIFIVFATKLGKVKRLPLAAFATVPSRGLIAIKLAQGDALIGVAMTQGDADIMLFNSAGRAIRFDENKVRLMGRSATGVRGMRLVGRSDADGDNEDVDVDENLIDEGLEADGDDELLERGKNGDANAENAENKVVSLVIVPQNAEFTILCACANGYGKRTPVAEFATKGRGGQGVIAIKTTARNGELVQALAVKEGEDVILITDKGTMVRTHVDAIMSAGRNAQGVRLMRVGAEETLAGVAAVERAAEDAAAQDE